MLWVSALFSGLYVKAGLACLGLAWWPLTDSHRGPRNQGLLLMTRPFHMLPDPGNMNALAGSVQYNVCR